MFVVDSKCVGCVSLEFFFRKFDHNTVKHTDFGAYQCGNVMYSSGKCIRGDW